MASRHNPVVGYAYLILWFGTFGVAHVTGNHLMVWVVDALATTPLPMVVVLGWLPSGASTLFLLADAARATAPSMRQPWASLLAVSGLLMALQVAVLTRSERLSSGAYRVAAHTPTADALTSGMFAAVAGLFLWTFFVQAGRWVHGRVRGERVRFSDNSWGKQPSSRRRFAVGAGVSVVAGLVAVLIGRS